MKPHPTHLFHCGHKLTRKPIRALLSLFTMATRRRPKIDDPGFENLTFRSGDGTRLAGWVYRTPGRENASGTVILAHGFTEHSGSQAATARELSARHGLVALAFDHRLHGWSGDHIPTFGTQEACDIQAAMNYADRSGLPKPYLLHGISLGALAAQRAGITDPRVAGLFLLACPAWPWDAIGVAVSGRTKHQLTLAGLLVNLYYGWDVLTDGDIRCHHQPEAHQPLVCYVMGDHDGYGINKTREAYAHWRGEGADNRFPSETPGLRKWFWSVPYAVHPGDRGYQIWDWPGYGRLREEFFERALARGSA